MASWGSSWGVSWGISWGGASAPAPVVEDAPSGGFWYAYEFERAKRELRRRRKEHEDAEVEQLQDVEREISQLLRAQEEKDAERREFERLSQLAAKYADKNEDMNERVRKALARANATHSAAAYAKLMLEIEKQMNEEEQALIAWLNS